MRTLLNATFQAPPLIFTGAQGEIADLAERLRGQRALLKELSGSASAFGMGRRERLIVTSNKPATVTAPIPHEASFEEKLFDVRVKLKVLVAQYAMHVSEPDRDRIFKQLDDIINIEDWHVEDVFPKHEAFQELLKWSIYSHDYDWTSLGVSDQGDILVSWITDSALLTANLAGKGVVRWTARIKSQTGLEHAAGSCSLQYFQKQAQFYLQQ
jgi:hypothetical protein